MVRQILINLVGNAIKFTPAGGSVYLSGRHAQLMAAMRFSVRDTGVGMNEEEIAHALTPFGQNREPPRPPSMTAPAWACRWPRRCWNCMAAA